MKVAFYSTSDEDLYRYRLPVARNLRDVGYQVVLVGPEGRHADAIESAGMTYRRVRFRRHGITPLSDLLSGMRLNKVYRAERPDISHHFTLHGVVHGAIAARMAGISWVVQSIPLLRNGESRSFLLRPGLRAFIRWSLRNTEVTFRMAEDRQFLISKGCVRPEQTHIIKSSGIDLDTYDFSEEPDRVPVVALIGTLQRSSEIESFAAAASALHREKVRARFVLVQAGKPSTKHAVCSDDLEQWQEEGQVEWWGTRSNLARSLSNVHVVYVPSCTDDESQRILLGAAATGRPVVAVNEGQCRELVQDGTTGHLIARGDQEALLAALRDLITHEERRRRMGRSARERAETEYSADRVARETMAVYERLFLKGREI